MSGTSFGKDNQDYRGYPLVVFIALPKSGTKSINKAFSDLGFKVFDVFQAYDYCEEFAAYGKEEIGFKEIADKFVAEKYDVILEPSHLYWHEMAEAWPKTKFVQVTRELEAWCKSFEGQMRSISQYTAAFPNAIDAFIWQNPKIFVETHKRLEALAMIYLESIGMQLPMYHIFKKEEIGTSQYKWPQHHRRRYRMFHADVKVNAPKDRTLFDWTITDGWNKLNKFLEIDQEGELPRTNEAGGAGQVMNLSRLMFINNKSEDLYRKELSKFLASNQMEMKVNESLS